jgi:hypothetical protein
MRKLVLVGLVLTAAATSAGAASGGTAPGCRAAQLGGRMSVLRGSAGAGQITYVLALRNRSPARCTISGMPGLRLLDRRGGALPTHERPASPGTGTAVLVTLASGGRAYATVRFSPDVPGPGEGTGRRCEPLAHAVRVNLPSPARGTLTAPVSPPTSVCSRGALSVGLLSSVRPRA